MADTIPTIDMSPLRGGNEAAKRAVARQIDEACRDTGFFLVTGHGVQPEDRGARQCAGSTPGPGGTAGCAR